MYSSSFFHVSWWKLLLFRKQEEGKGSWKDEGGVVDMVAGKGVEGRSWGVG